MLHEFQQYLHTALKKEDAVLVTVSGGLDSVVMAHLFRDSGCNFGIAHCNFGLRGAESDGDEAFVAALAAQWGVPFFTKKFDTEGHANAHKISIQMAARDLRYEWWERLRAEHQYDFIATAHHRDDSVETALFNFSRGTGLRGLTGIASGTAVLIRPLLFAGREAIRQYALEHNIAWRDDSSNATDDYARNFIRHQIIPRFEALNPAFLKTAADNLERLRDTDRNLDFLLQEFLGPRQGLPVWPKAKLQQLPGVKAALVRLLKPYGFDQEQARQVAEHLTETGLELRSASFRLLIDRDTVRVISLAAPEPEVLLIGPDDLMVRLPEGGSLFLTQVPAVPPFPDGQTAVTVDAKTLVYPLKLRNWQSGDAFKPFGMGGKSQKLQDFFTNQKLSRIDKEQVRLLENGDGNIVWVLGFRLDERFKVERSTRVAIQITWVMR